MLEKSLIRDIILADYCRRYKNLPLTPKERKFILRLLARFNYAPQESPEKAKYRFELRAFDAGLAGRKDPPDHFLGTFRRGRKVYERMKGKGNEKDY